ncbi:DUF6600 domain-containing protein [Candidatus Accumulibacter sp. ACC003]|uniref:DUF6600 domain-containing protein n=1 Tax=Candidatus Accumulibacter sp. ACC003 TaxID=2823334 RepID=UPI0025C1800E|nr:DUF6600 domain-containing protein [Candidatus Accumulibacter sp. ACC003]
MSFHFAVLRRCRQVLAILLLTLLAALPAVADPSGRVGRIAWLSGSVHLHRADSGESSSALLNWPISTGDVLSTAAGARSEVQIGSTLLQLDSASVLEFVLVDDQRVHLRLLDGSVLARLRSADAAREFVLSTRDGDFSPREVGSYRFDADRSTVSASVLAGSLRFEASDSALEVSVGQRAQLWNDGRTHYQLSAPANDDFALWSAGRPRPLVDAGHGRYVSPEMTGAADLDAYGSWSDNAEYGAVWFPRAVAADWAPYRNGRWLWVEPWGWTWVGDEAWGFAPFHYGRWVLYGGAWGWVPGRRVARPVYAPALVAWVGTPGAGVSVQVGTRPAVGWFPLAPREVYVPPYRASANHVRQVNITQVTQINNITAITSDPQAAVARMPYAHRQQPRALTMVPANVLTEHRQVSGAAMPARDRQQLGSQTVQVQAPVAAPPVDAPRRAAAGRQFEQAGRQFEQAGRAGEAGRLPGQEQLGGRGDRRQQPPVAGAAVPLEAASAAVPPAPTAARTPPPGDRRARPENAPPIGSSAPLPAPASAPPPAPVAGERPEVGRSSGQGQREREAGRTPGDESPGGRADRRQAPPVAVAPSPLDAPAAAVPPPVTTRTPSGMVGNTPAASPPVRPLGASAPLPAPAAGAAAGSTAAPVGTRVEPQGGGRLVVDAVPGNGARTPAGAGRSVSPAAAPAALPVANERIDRSESAAVRRAADPGALGSPSGGGVPVQRVPGASAPRVDLPASPTRSPAAIETAAPNRAAAAAARPSVAPERFDPRPSPSPTVVPQSPASGAAILERPAAPVNRASAASPGAPEQRREAPLRPLPSAAVPPAFSERATAAVPAPPTPAAAQRPDVRAEPRRPDAAAHREDASARQARPEMRGDPRPVAPPPAVAPGRLEAAPANDRPARADRRQGAGGGPGERQGDPRENRQPRGPDG